MMHKDWKAKALDLEVKRDIAVSTLENVKAHSATVQKALAKQCKETKKLRAELVQAKKVSVTLTGKEIRELAGFAGLQIVEHNYADEYETEITVETPSGFLLNDDGVEEHYRLIAYLTEYPEEGAIGLGDALPAAQEPQINLEGYEVGVASRDAEVNDWRSQAHRSQSEADNAIAECDQLRAELAMAKADIARLKREDSRVKRVQNNSLKLANKVLSTKLAVEQVKNVRLLDFIARAQVSSGVCCCGDTMDGHPSPMSCGHSPIDVWDHAVGKLLDAPSDTSALEAIVKKAGEVMREKCADASIDLYSERSTFEAIHALPGVTLEDLK